MNRIEKKFRELRKKNKKAFIVFITAGYPNLKITEKLVLNFSKIGVDIIELGVPFSDPLADGPIIQEASEAALKKKTYLKDILSLARRIRKYTQIPLVLMTYYNPVFCFGEKKFVKEATASGIDGVIIPDFPPEEARSFIRLANKFNLDNICFLAPTSDLKRIKLVSRLARGFIYYVSLTGVTGPRERLPEDITNNLRVIKSNTCKPICVGFGVSNKEQIKQIYKIADGVILGSAVIRKIKENINKPDLVKRVTNFVVSLMR